jgi:fused signal recognition particle receptor
MNGDHNDQPDERKTPIIKYSPAEAEIATLKAKYTGLKIVDIADSEGYEKCRLAAREVAGTRIAIEKRRKELKEDSLEWGRKVDGAAKKLQALVAEVEAPLDKELKRIDDLREAEARAKVKAEQDRIAAEEKAKRDQEEAELKARVYAEDARLAEERRKLEEERAKMEAERRKANEEYAAKIRADREAFAAEAAERARKIKIQDEEQARIAKEERERRAKEDEAARLAEKEREHRAWQIAQEQERIAQAQRKKQAELDAAQASIDQAKREAQERIDRELFEKAAKEQAEQEAAARAKRTIEEAKRQHAEDVAEAKRIEAARPDVEKIRSMGDTLEAIQWPMPNDAGAQAFVLTMKEDVLRAARLCRGYATPKKKGKPTNADAN